MITQNGEYVTCVGIAGAGSYIYIHTHTPSCIKIRTFWVLRDKFIVHKITQNMTGYHYYLERYDYPPAILSCTANLIKEFTVGHQK